MRNLFFVTILLIPLLNLNAQGIGKLVPEAEPESFPNNAFGLDIMFSDGGFGLGTFYRYRLSSSTTFFTDFSMSEAKDEKEFEYVDYYGRTFTVGKKNRVFMLPLNFGLQYRLFKKVIYDNLRPYVNFGVGPAMVITTPYDQEFFNAFGSAKLRVTTGGYVGFGANFGLDKSSLVGINFRYYIIHFFDQGVESLAGRFKKDIGGFFITLNIGTMY